MQPVVNLKPEECTCADVPACSCGDMWPCRHLAELIHCEYCGFSRAVLKLLAADRGIQAPICCKPYLESETNEYKEG
jgi:hypothetical protein